MAFCIKVEGFLAGGTIPRDLTCDGANRSPALSWSGAPVGTRSFALIVDDPDAPAGTWNHWLIWNIPGSASGLKEAAPLDSQIRSGMNDFGKCRYDGPCPPKGHAPHRYFFRLFATDVEDLGLSAGARRAKLDKALASHILDAVEYMGRYERR
jgi:hypothetical protein